LSDFAVKPSHDMSQLAVTAEALRPARAAKRALDVAAATLLLALLSPLLCLIAILVRVTSRGPAIYRRRVLGVGGVEFDAFKFRSMVEDADSRLDAENDLSTRFRQNMKLRSDPRVTGLGRLLRRLSLDELPQLFNVLRGEMSLVGPRMIAPEEAQRYGSALMRRLSVRPGITGLWQVSGRQEVDYDTRIALDMQYIDNWSLGLDFVILLRTLPAVLSTKGAY
jgi:lipopolysaccharide/colanic/teichoic acid biosynthesis glycosyltransferase